MTAANASFILLLLRSLFEAQRNSNVLECTGATNNIRPSDSLVSLSFLVRRGRKRRKNSLITPSPCRLSSCQKPYTYTQQRGGGETAYVEGMIKVSLFLSVSTSELAF